jgi:aryl-alcohol dehydrogenase-like predicted oxidoreductase
MMNYKIFGRSGLRVSELCLGTMTFGTEWGYGADENTSRLIFFRFLEEGGNFIDTANRYTEGTSEKFLGKFIAESRMRDQLVIASKYSLFTKEGRINDSGNHRKNLVQTVEGSLQRMNLDFMDILYVHAWDFTTRPDEVMRALDDLVRSGKVLHVAVSDTPAWIIAQCNTLADLRGWSAFCGVQLEYSLITRDAERELLPMCNHLELGVTAWAPLAGGALSGKYLSNEAGRVKADSRRRDEKSNRIAATVVQLAGESGVMPTHVALNWILKKHKNVIPVVGARTIEQIDQNLNALKTTLNEEQFIRLEEVSAIELGFPHDFYAQEGVQKVLYGGLRNKIQF